MALDRISLIDFRNHAATELGETAQFNLLVGENGAGKTNILEALSLLAPGRGLRRAALGDMMRSDSGAGFRIGADLRQDDGPIRLGTYMDSANPGRRRSTLPFRHRRQCQQPSALFGVHALPRQTAQRLGTEILTKSNRSRHRRLLYLRRCPQRITNSYLWESLQRVRLNDLWY